MTIRISEFTDKHLPEIAGLLDEEYRGSFEFIPFSEERILSLIRRRHLKILVAEGDGTILGLIATHLEERGEVSISWLAAKGSNRAFIENILIDEVEKRAEGDTISTTADEGSGRINYWNGRGYTLNPGWLRMSAKLGSLRPVPKVAEGIKLRRLRPTEEEKLIEVTNTGFGWQRLELGDLEEWKSTDPPFNEDWVQVAEFKERIISAVVGKPDTDYNKYLHLNRGYLGPAATLPEFRNMHLASALTALSMNFLLGKGLDSVRLGTSEENVSSIALLRTLGFQVDNVRKVLRKKLSKG